MRGASNRAALSRRLFAKWVTDRPSERAGCVMHPKPAARVVRSKQSICVLKLQTVTQYDASRSWANADGGACKSRPLMLGHEGRVRLRDLCAAGCFQGVMGKWRTGKGG